MVKIVGIRFRGAGKIYSFDKAGFDVSVGQKVVVETIKGIELGTVVLGEREIDEETLETPLRPIVRIATEEDIAENERHKQLEKEARPIFYEKMRMCGLEMKLVEVEYFFDNSKIMFYYTSDARVDFRELVKELATAFHARIELRQIGVRNETQYFGGIGVCGRELCCHSFLADFGSVTIKMAKDQELPLTSSKISGMCGRLMCCLQNEHETYLYLNENMPSQGDIVENAEGQKGEVIEKSIIKQKVKVRFVTSKDEAEVKEYNVSEIKKVYTKKEYNKLLENGEIKQLTYQRKEREPQETSNDTKNSKAIDRNVSLAEEKSSKYAGKTDPLKPVEKKEKNDKTPKSEQHEQEVAEDKQADRKGSGKKKKNHFRHGGYENQKNSERKK